jgi:alanine-synthesizing transaminase
MFAKRTNWELTPNRVAGILEGYKRSGQEILDLTESNPTRCGFVYPQGELLAHLSAPVSMRYVPSSQGLLSARQAVAAYYQSQNIAISPTQIFLTASTSEAYSFLFRLLANPQEAILFPAPSYPLFDFLVDLNDLKSSFYPLVYQGQWAIDLGELENSISAQTKAVVAVNPNNPTGSYIAREELKHLNRMCQQNHLALISDEVFFDYAFDRSQRFVSCTANTENLTFTLGGLSKTLALPQMKLSWIVVNGPPDIVAEAIARLEIIADTYLSVNAPVQNALASWLTFRPAIQEQIIKRVAVNRDYLVKSFSDYDAGAVLHADGGWYMIVKLLGGVDEESVAEQLLLRDQVYVHPGYFFNFSEEAYLILSLLPAESVFIEGVKRIIARVKSFNSSS